MIYRYKYPERFASVKMPDFEKLQDRLVLFGAGLYGGMAALLLKSKGYDFVCFCDNDVKKQGTVYYGHEVLSFEQCFERYPDASILITVHNFRGLLEQLKVIGYNRIYNCASLFVEFDVSIVEPALRERKDIGQIDSLMHIYLRRIANACNEVNEWGSGKGNTFNLQIDISTTERCTLRCKECTSLMTYYSTPVDMDWDSMKAGLSRAMDAVSNCLYCLEGGEVFLFPHLAELIKMLCGHSNTENVWIITNGTMLPKPDVLEALTHPKCLVRISDYREHSHKLNELKELCEENGIPVIVYGANWTKMSEIKDYHRTDEQNQELMVNCCKGENGALFLLHNRLYKCPFAANAERLGIIPRVEEDSVNLLQESLDPIGLKNQINALFTRHRYIEACKYCNGRSSTGLLSDVVPPAEQLTGPVPELPKVF